MAEYAFLLESAVIWAILLVALFCYGLLMDLCFMHKVSETWFDRTQYWLKSIRTILASLPLLGLLGTITGLLTTFFRMSVENGFNLQEVISGGIAEAMFTTQLGLIMVIPGLLMLAHLQAKTNRWVALRR
ncbi:MotA/TolQ/ExbB proton channel family protein [Litorilituus sediminis]|uniref:Transporter n=1 Tax=Litorilituus sediminis TaxID=718192 RepID=A0A4P6P2Y1_9GAMM|nr:MotA/TolQ/ExbB proton channel family protein [Litorilituus sediminis]QBG35681.1 transporter [Litorilituus sediminis]